MQLICFPHAGGFASYYNFLKAGLSDSISINIYEYSGRGKKVRERPYLNFFDCVERISEDLYKGINNEEYALFGHSMGAYAAYEVAKVMQNKYYKPVKFLFVSGQVPPAQHKKNNIHKYSNEKFIEYLLSIGGINEDILQFKELLDMVIPIIRSDFNLIENYTPSVNCIKLKTNLCVLYGKNDKEINGLNIDEWSNYSERYLGSKAFNGEHFYFQGCKDDIIRYIDFVMKCK